MLPDGWDLSYKLEKRDEWRKWIKDIPFIEFPPTWKVKIIPPFGNAIVRFIIMVGPHEVSIYLDCYDKLGCFGSPYWEVYPCEGSTGRCKMDDTKTLLEMIANRNPAMPEETK